MGEDIIDKAVKLSNLPAKKSITRTLHLHAYKKDVNFSNPMYFYGADIDSINNMIKEKPVLRDWVSEDLQINKAQVVWAFKEEMARSVEDVLARRTRALFLDAAESIRIAPVVAEILAHEFGYDSNWIDNQVENFSKLAKGYLLK